MPPSELYLVLHAREKNEVLTGLFYVNPAQPNFTDLLNLVDEPLGTLPQEAVRPPRSVLDRIMRNYNGEITASCEKKYLLFCAG